MSGYQNLPICSVFEPINSIDETINGDDIELPPLPPLPPIPPLPIFGTVVAYDLAEARTFNPLFIRAFDLAEEGKEGKFFWRAGDFSEFVARDPLSGVYIVPNGYSPSYGAYVRSTQGILLATWFGLAVGNSRSSNTEALAAALTFAAKFTGALSIPHGDFNVATCTVTLDGDKDRLHINGLGIGATNLRYNGSDGIRIEGIDAPWWLIEHGKGGNAVSCKGISFIQHGTGNSANGVAIRYNGRSVAGRPTPPTLISECAFCSDNLSSSWRKGIELISVSSATIEKCSWAGCLNLNDNGAIFIDLSASVGRDASPYHIRGCEGYYFSKVINAGEYIEGVHVSDCDFVGCTYGIWWDASVSGAESQLCMSNVHIKATTRAVFLNKILDSQIVGCLLWTNAENAIGIEIRDGTMTNIVGNTIACPGGGMTNGVFFSSADWPSSYYANKASYIGGNVISNCYTGVAMGPNVRNVTVDNAYANVSVQVIDVSGLNRILN